MAFRRLKKQVLALLQADDFDGSLSTIARLPARQVINPLLGLLYDGDLLVRWRSITAIGVVTAGLALRDADSARNIMRRLMWNLNDESGGMGWGSPEAMGEIMARHAGLAGEYASILISYIDPAGNFLEHPGLQEGVLWAIGRLARANPLLVREATSFLLPFLYSPQDRLRGLALWASGPLSGDPRLRPRIQALGKDSAVFGLYREGQIVQQRVADLAKAALVLSPNFS